jgi:hypothetical protein
MWIARTRISLFNLVIFGAISRSGYLWSFRNLSYGGQRTGVVMQFG